MIQELDDASACEILSVIGRGRAESEGGVRALDPALRQALAAFARNMRPTLESTSTSAGDLARQALLLLAEDSATRDAIAAMAANWQSQRRKFDFGATLAITTAVLVVLQTHIKFERSPDGQWSMKFEKKPTSEALLKTLLQKFLNYTN